MIHDYTRKGGVVVTGIAVSDGAPDWARDRSALWNAAEAAEKRKNSTVAREVEIPSLLRTQQEKLHGYDHFKYHF